MLSPFVCEIPPKILNLCTAIATTFSLIEFGLYSERTFSVSALQTTLDDVRNEVYAICVHNTTTLLPKLLARPDPKLWLRPRALLPQTGVISAPFNGSRTPRVSRSVSRRRRCHRRGSLRGACTARLHAVPAHAKMVPPLFAAPRTDTHIHPFIHIRPSNTHAVAPRTWQIWINSDLIGYPCRPSPLLVYENPENFRPPCGFNANRRTG